MFSDLGWVHAEAECTCSRLIVAWPPPMHGDDTDDISSSVE